MKTFGTTFAISVYMKTLYLLFAMCTLNSCFLTTPQSSEEKVDHPEEANEVNTISPKDFPMGATSNVSFDAKTNTYSIGIEGSTKVIAHLKFAKQIRTSFQTLDQANQIKYYDNDLNELEQPNDFFGLCGTVPHYTLSQEETADAFIFFKDETFYDIGNAEPKEEFARILKSDADSVLFLNGAKKWSFTSNFGIGHIPFADPEALILFKNNQCAVSDEQLIWYDGFDFSFVSPNLKTKRNTLEGIYGLVEPKYLTIEPFEYFLSNVQFIDGEWGFIDHEGNEYR